MKKLINNYTELKEIEEAIEFKYIFINNKPGYINHFEYLRKPEKFKKNKSEEEKIKVKVIVEDLFTGEEIYKGTLKDKNILCLKGEFKEYLLCNLNLKTGETRLLDLELNEERDDIILNLDLRKEFNNRLISAYKQQEITVNVFETFEEKIIVDFEI